MMQPKPSVEIPEGDDWIYEVKYDGFRAALKVGKSSIKLISRNNVDLSANFPEIISYVEEHMEQLEDFLPFELDGEIVILNTILQSNFYLLQQRGRFKTAAKIKQAAKERPAHFLAFDLLTLKGKSLLSKPFSERKEKLHVFLMKLLPTSSILWDQRLGYVQTYSNSDELWDILTEHKGEGVVAKRITSKYIDGKSHSDWFKIKNWRTIRGFITSYDQKNGYFTLSIYENEAIQPLGKFKHGIPDQDLDTLKQFVSKNGTKKGDIWQLPPAICCDVHCLGVKEDDLREPEFYQFRLDVTPEECTKKTAEENLAMFPEDLDLSKKEKIFWPEPSFTKLDLLLYLRDIAPYMLPFLKNKVLTLIRCPDGVEGEFFYQKHLPSYAPDILAGPKTEDGILQVCKDVEGLLYLGNHGAMEYHVPFQRMGKHYPDEIVFDLDPPSVEQFSVAVFAAQLLKELLDHLQLKAFVKTSGNKGLQIYIPIPEKSLTYDETAQFTMALALLLENKYSDLFTTERLKKNRKNRLYIDYIQHGKDKTLVAPYSPRKTEEGTVSTPLFWAEVTEELQPNQFTIQSVVQRVKELGCPFITYQQARETQDVELLRQFTTSSSNK
ncbi:DNA ligase D [Radiobacillus kanasensis]|uniref:DNA ligase D n=1 Tax=Radiobacillus kanasensis TaxID=2844358 RepID=UPI001E2BCE39|nr:DNA ligase D [Radiobacillus kanasensis]UFT99004.1 DNA ligase D [Radiobacillus kanasensis]